MAAQDLLEAMRADTENLLAESNWVRALARHLAGDAHRADDLFQDAFVAAMEGRRSEGVPTRRWLGTVLRNLVRQERRSSGRREAREGEIARPEAGGEPAHDSLERLEAQRAVVEAVAGLHEPYRTAVVLRYFDGLPPRAIAKRLGVPVRTVHTQLDRARGLLRTRLERRFGDDVGAWLPVLGLLIGAQHSGKLLGTTLGAFWMDAKLKLAAGAVALVGLVAVVGALKSADPQESARTDVLAAAPVLEQPVPSTLEVEAGVPMEESLREELVVQAQVEEVSPLLALPSLEGIVIDVEGRPMAGLEVGLFDATGVRKGTSTTDEQGRVGFELEQASGTLDVIDERWATIIEPVFWSGVGAQPKVVVVAPRTSLAGMVVNEAGEPMEGVLVHVTLPWNFRARIPYVLDGSRVKSMQATTDELGAFELSAAAIPGVFMFPSKTGHVGAGVELPQVSTHDLLLTMGVPDDPSFLRGTVVDEQGFAVEGARVALAFAHTKSGADGSFVLRASEGDEAGVLSALIPGRMPARIERQGDSNVSADAWPDPIVLRLGGEPLSLAGRVLDEEGEPLEGATVQLVDLTPFGPIEFEDRRDVTMAGFVEPLVAGGRHASQIRTGANGRFSVKGLLERPYSLSVTLKERVLYSEFGPFDAGHQDLVLRLEPEPTIARIAGVVTSMGGDPLEGAIVSLIAKRPEGSRAETNPFTQRIYGDQVHTAADGSFEMLDVSARVFAVTVAGRNLGLGTEFPLADHADLEHVELRVPMRCHVQVDLTASTVEADDFSLEDANGVELQLGIFHGNIAFSSPRVDIVEGRSEAVSASEAARTLVLFLKGEEVLRLPLELEAGELNVLTP